MVRDRAPAQPAPARIAAAHAVALAIGCALLTWAYHMVGLARGNWAVLTLCLVFVPSTAESRRRVIDRTLGTVAGAAAAALIAVAAPAVVCLALAAVCAVLTVAYSLMPDPLLSVVFLTPAVLLLTAGGIFRNLAALAAERVAMTLAGGILAILLTAVAFRQQALQGTAGPHV